MIFSAKGARAVTSALSRKSSTDTWLRVRREESLFAGFTKNKLFCDRENSSREGRKEGQT